MKKMQQKTVNQLMKVSNVVIVVFLTIASYTKDCDISLLNEVVNTVI